MRIALVTHKFTRGDGQGRVNYEIAHAALRAGHEVWLVASEVSSDLAATGNAHVVPVSVDGWPSRLVQNQVFAFKSAFWLARNRRRLDVVHVNGFITWVRADINTAHFVHGAWLRSPVHTWRLKRGWYGLYQLMFSKVNFWLERRAYRSSAIVVAVSEQVRRELQSEGVTPETIRVIPNGVDLNEFCPGGADRHALGLPQGVVLLFVGEIRTPRKNLDTLLRALRDIPEAVLCVVGDTAQSPYPALARRLGVSERVTFLGYRSDVAQLMKAADVFVFPSRYEACSLVLLEAMASGLPIVAASSTGGTELLTPECSVLISDADNATELSAALKPLVRDSALRARMAAEAASLARQHPWGIMAERYLRIYQECGEQRAAPVTQGPRENRTAGMTGGITVLICTMNRPTELRRCLGSVRASGFPVAQTVVSDDSSDGRTRDLVRSEFHWVQYLDGPRRGLGANRNRALSAASGELVLFMDDDACLDKHFVESSLRARARTADPDRVIVSGCVLEHGRVIRAHDQSFLGYQNVPYRPGQRLRTIVMSSALFPRKLFQLIKFDEKLLYGYDEVDIASQALRHGYQIVHCDEAINSHHPSAINRDGYRSHTDASRMYVTFKRYAHCERAYAKAAVFVLLAPLHCLVSATRRKGLSGFRDGWTTVRSAARFATSSGAGRPRA